MSKPRLLIVEDEQDIRELLGLHLRREGYDVEEAPDGEAAGRVLSQAAQSSQTAGRPAEELGKGPFELLVIDWMLPGLSGLEIARSVREGQFGEGLKRVPILMVTARGEPSDLISGLEAGADDYVTKPFDLSVMMARVRALLRRGRWAKSLAQAGLGKPSSAELPGIKIDTQAHEVSVDGEPVHLTPYEFKLLVALAQNRGRVLTREKLMELVQGSGVAVVDRAIDTHVFGLRKKLGARADVIETVRGVGYRVVLGEG